MKINENNNNNSDKENLRYISFPYIKGYPKILRKYQFTIFIPLLNQPLYSFLLSKLKDSEPLLNEINLVYKIYCLSDETYTFLTFKIQITIDLKNNEKFIF